MRQVLYTIISYAIGIKTASLSVQQPIGALFGGAAVLCRVGPTVGPYRLARPSGRARPTRGRGDARDRG